MKKKEKSLTEAFIKSKEESDRLKLIIPTKEILRFQNYSHFLIIQSFTRKYSKITIYPINNKKVTKIQISGKNINQKKMNNILNIIKNFDIIHTSGLLARGKKMFYEVYINHTLQDLTNPIKSNITTSFKRIRLIKEIRIKEIKLK
jgi:hypothetical protein